MSQFENLPEKGYNPGMPSINRSKVDQAMPAAVGYVAILAVSILGFQFFETGLQRVTGISLLVAFTILFATIPDQHVPTWKLHLYMSIMTVIVAALLVMQPNWGVFPMLFFVLSPTAMMIFPQRIGMIWIGIFTLVTAGVFLALMPVGEALLISLPYSAGYWFFGAFARALASAEDARQESQRLLSELQITHRQLQEYAARVEELAVAEERNRLSREMHDTLGHRLTVAAVQLEGAQRLIPRDPERAANMVSTVRSQVREALSELRSAVATLREPFEIDLPISAALQRLCSTFAEATHLKVQLNLPEELPILPNAHRLAFYRAAQEALTNVQRHAQAGQVWIDLVVQANCVALTVSDDGVGFPTETREAAFGLRGMRERAAHLGGELQLKAREAGGAQVKLILPLVEVIADDRNNSIAACR
jgi:signal transduction histidine kinase